MYILLFFFYLFALEYSNKYDNTTLFGKNVRHNNYIILMLYAAGIGLLGVLPILFSTYKPGEIFRGNTIPSNIQVFTCLILCLIAVHIAIIEARKKILLPHFTYSLFSKSFIVGFILTRTIFLFSYELYFRGYLLRDTLEWLPTVYAIFLNIVLYTLIHLFSSRRELIACTPFGLIMCLLCLWTGAAWPAILIHISLGITHEGALLYYNSKHLKPIT